MDLAPAPPRRRALWIILAFIGIVLVSLGAIFLEAWISAGNLLERERARLMLDRATEKDLSFTRPNPFEPAEDGNAWTEFQRACAEFDAIPSADYDVFPMMSGDEFPKIDDDAIGVVLGKMEPAFESVRRTLRQRKLELKRDDAGGTNSVSSGLIRLARVLGDSALHRHRRGDDSGAVDYLGMGLAASSLMSPRGWLIDELVRMVAEGIQFPAAKVILASHDLKVADLAAFAAVLDAIPEPVVMWREWAWEMRGLILDPRNTCTARKDRWNYKMLPFRFRRAQCLQWVEIILAEQERIAGLQPWEQADAAATFDQRLEKAPKFIAQMGDSYWRSVQNRAVNRLQRTLVRVSVAVAQFEAATGGYPKSLQDLVPKYLPSVPVDPWNGKPLVYEIRGASAVVYSIGGDGNDDGGRSVSDDTDMDQEGDIVWTVKRRAAESK